MNTRLLLMSGLTALTAAVPMAGGSLIGTASASTPSAERLDKAFTDSVAKATRALTAKKAGEAVHHAEAAVALKPQDAGSRALLGRAYLAAGRFASAKTAFGDAMALSGGAIDGADVLDFALTQVGTGDWAAARATLTTHADRIAAGDRGLALALAGDPQGGIALLTSAARADSSSATVRQNLGLAYALAGQWPAARAVAAADLSPADVDHRMEQWLHFVQPTRPSDQVAALLGLTVVDDAGQPVALALNAPVSAGQAPVATAEAAPAPVAVPAAAPAPVAVAAAAAVAPEPALAGVAFGPRAEVVQSLPTKLLVADAQPIKVALAEKVAAPAAPQPARPLAKGSFFVQIGAFESAAVAKDAWGRATRRLPTLAGYAPNGMTFTAKVGQVYRLSVGGFTRDDADRLCRRYRSSGGVCFVRAGAGDQIATWSRRKGTQLASR